MSELYKALAGEKACLWGLWWGTPSSTVLAGAGLVLTAFFLTPPEAQGLVTSMLRDKGNYD